MCKLSRLSGDNSYSHDKLEMWLHLTTEANFFSL